MRAPLVAVSAYHLPSGRVTGWQGGAHAVPDTYISALRRAGARPAILPSLDDADAKQMLDPFDALLVIGGGDVEPARYGASEQHPDDYGIDELRDQFEVDLLLQADRSQLPTLAICRGVQVLNVAFGGTLHQHLPETQGFDQHRHPVGETFLHEVKVAEGSRLAEATGTSTLRCLSAHHQGVAELGEGLAQAGWSGDGLVEALEREQGWMLGVQWHPEETASEDRAQQALFDALVAQARRGA